MFYLKEKADEAKFGTFWSNQWFLLLKKIKKSSYLIYYLYSWWIGMIVFKDLYK